MDQTPPGPRHPRAAQPLSGQPGAPNPPGRPSGPGPAAAQARAAASGPASPGQPAEGGWQAHGAWPAEPSQPAFAQSQGQPGSWQAPSSGPEWPPHGPPQGPPHGPTGQPPYGNPPYAVPPYAVPPYAPYARPNEPSAVTAMVLGILGLAVCGVVAPFAWAIGNKSLQNIKAHPGAYDGEGMARAGYIMGIVGTALLALSVLFLILWFVMVGSLIQAARP